MPITRRNDTRNAPRPLARAHRRARSPASPALCHLWEPRAKRTEHPRYPVYSQLERAQGSIPAIDAGQAAGAHTAASPIRAGLTLREGSLVQTLPLLPRGRDGVALLIAICALMLPLASRPAWAGVTLSPQLSPAAAVANDSLAEARRAFDAGKTAFDAKNFDAAATAFERAAALNPSDARTQLWLGNAYINQAFTANIFRKARLAPRARDAWLRAAALDPRDIESREYLAGYFDQAPGIVGGSAERATAMAQQVRAIDPYRGALLLGSLAERHKDLALAERYYAEAAARPGENDGRGFEAWVVTLEAQQRYAEAYRAASARLKAMPADYLALYHIGRVAGLSGEHVEEGMAALRRARTLERPAATRFGASGVPYWLGILLERTGDRAGAAAELRMSLTMNPSDQKAKDALARVTATP